MNKTRNNSGGQKINFNSEDERKSYDSTKSQDPNRYSFDIDSSPSANRTSDFDEEFDNPNLVSGVKWILELPRQCRCEIWKRVGYKYYTELRLTCSKIKNDVDHHVGISVYVDQGDSVFESFFFDVGIRKATIIYLGSPIIQEFLMHPELLVELSIHGTISTAYFKYLMKKCENIRRLSIVFNKRMLKMRPMLFPQLFFDCLPKCRSIRFVSHTKKEKDLIYICDNITGLVKDTLEDSREMTDIQFSLIHGSPSPYLEELVLEIIVFAHKNSRTLHEFHLNVKEKETSKAAQEAANDDEGYKRRDTAALPRPNDPSNPPSLSNSDTSELGTGAEDFAKDRKNSAIMEDADRYVRKMRWNRLPLLKKIFLSVNSRAFDFLKEMPKHSPYLSSLQLELNGGIIRNCWFDYRDILNTDLCRNITAIKLVGISFKDETDFPLDIDFIAFKKCTSLKKLFLSSHQNDITMLNKAKNIAKLPPGLEDLELGWVTLTAWQWFRLLYCFKKLDKIAVSYATTSDSNFGWIMKIIRWLISFNMTKVQQFVVTDIKIKFRNKRATIKKLEKAVPIKIEYLDFEQTLLSIDRGHGRHSQASIPSIASE